MSVLITPMHLFMAQGDGNGFREDDQVAAWTAAQDGATKSKQGLGRSEQPRKVGGAQWQGTRTKLGSDDEATCVHGSCFACGCVAEAVNVWKCWQASYAFGERLLPMMYV
jgi:hypothetical protein